MKKIFAFTSFLILFSNPLFSEDNFVFAPFVSRLKVYEENSSVKISWKDSRDIKGTYLIYRHTEQIDRSNFSDALVVEEIDAGTETYTDRVSSNTDFYYAVVAKNNGGEIFNIFLPYRNITLLPVSVKTIEKTGDNAAIVRYLNVSGKNDSLILSFNSSDQDRHLAVLRNIEPIFTSSDIAASTILNVIPSYRRSYTDFPIPGVPYFYAVVDSELVKTQNAELIPFENTTINSSEIPIGRDLTVAELYPGRRKPLPGYRLYNYLESGERIQNTLPEYNRAKEKLTINSDSIVSSLKNRYSPAEKTPEPGILDTDKNSNENSGETRLEIIIEKYFMAQDWENGEKALEDLLRSTEKKSLKNRLNYYLGQVFYFRNKPEKAFICFLAASENYYPEAKKWMDIILSAGFSGL